MTSTELAPRVLPSAASINLGVAGVSLSPTGLRLPQRLSPKDWHDIGTALGRLNGMSAWAVGDWVNANPATRTTVVPEIAALVGLSVETVREYARLALKFPAAKRNPKVPWGHHQVVQALPPERQEELLDQAARENWTGAALRLKVGWPSAQPKPEPKPKGTRTVLGAASPKITMTVEWAEDIADDPDLIRTMNQELKRMVAEWDFVAKVEVA